jgi:hypothetical protein
MSDESKEPIYDRLDEYAEKFLQLEKYVNLNSTGSSILSAHSWGLGFA